MAKTKPLILILIVVNLLSCEHFTDLAKSIGANKSGFQDPEKVYRYDMAVIVNGEGADGIVVASESSSYEISIEAKQKLDLLTARSCHREISFDPVKSRRGIFGNSRKEFRFTFTPSQLEKQDCPLELYGFSKQNGRHSFAMIDFQSLGDQLEARLSCNGETRPQVGVALCQSRARLMQEITFKEKVKVSPDESCKIGPVTEGTTFRFGLVKGICTYIFLGLESKKTMRLTTIGYEDIVISLPED